MTTTETISLNLPTEGEWISSSEYNDNLQKIDAAFKAVNELLGKLSCPYQVGDFLLTLKTEDPADTYPGTTWERVAGRFLLGATDGGATNTNANASQEAGSMAGEASHTLTSAESGTSSHSHGLNNHTHSLSNHTHSLSNHTHGLSSHTHTTNIGSHSHGVQLTAGSGNQTPNSISYSTAAGYTNTSGFIVSANIGNKTSGGPSSNTSGTPSNNTSGTPSSNTSGTPSTSNTENSVAADASAAHNNMPPFLAVYIWKRTA